MDELYRTKNLVVRRIPGADLSRWVVTFDNHSAGEGFDRPAFGEEFLARSGISAIHFLGRGNDWYQYPDLPRALKAARRALEGATRVVAYGSSMGGYAAIRLAGKLGAHGVLALSPQWTINPAKVPWEGRWVQDAHRIDWRPDIDGPIRRVREIVAIYDPSGLDRRHIDLIADEVGVKRVALPYTGHPATTFLGEVSLLGPAVLDMIAGRFSPKRFRREARRRRRQSSIYLGELAQAQLPVRPRLALRLARQAVAVSPDGALALLSLGRCLSAVGEHDEALTVLARAVEMGNRYAGYLVPYADALYEAGRRAEAIRLARETVAATPRVAHLQHWLAWMLWHDGHHRKAIRMQRRAVSLDPETKHYRRALTSYRVQFQIGLAPGRTRSNRLARAWSAVRSWFS